MSDPVPGVNPRLLRTLLVIAAACLGLVVLSFTLWGCAASSNKVEGGTTSLGTTEVVKAPQTTTTTTVDPRTGEIKVSHTEDKAESVTTIQTASASGPKQETRGEKVDTSISVDPQTIELPGGAKAKGGGFNADALAVGGSKAMWIFIIAGVGCFGGLLYCLSIKPLPSIRGAITCGLGLAACVAAIWLGSWVIVGIAAVGVGLYLYSERDRLFARTALAGVMKAVKESGTVEAVKSEIPSQLDEKYLAYLDRIRRSNGM